MTRGARARGVAAVGGLIVAFFSFSAPADASQRPKVTTYKVRIGTFIQTRTWSYHYDQAGLECDSATDGTGTDEVQGPSLQKALLVLEPNGRGTAGFTMGLIHSRLGSMSHVFTPVVSGAQCAENYEQSADGCGGEFGSAFPTLTLKGEALEFRWNGSFSIPEFNPCPYYDGEVLPGPSYLDLSFPINRKRLLAGKIDGGIVGKSEIAESETCDDLPSCPDGVSYSAEASVDAQASLILKPKKR